MSDIDRIEARRLEKYVEIQPVVVEGFPDAHNVFLKVTNQRFSVTPYACETKADAEWTREMLCIALMKIVMAETPLTEEYKSDLWREKAIKFAKRCDELEADSSAVPAAGREVLERLRASIAALRMALPMGNAGVERQVLTLLAQVDAEIALAKSAPEPDWMAASISSTGATVTIECNDLDTKDAVFDWLEGRAALTAPDKGGPDNG